MKILILDDDELILKWLKDLFTKLGVLEVCTVQDVEDFRFQLSVKHFDLCIVDVLLPGSTNGVEVIERSDVIQSKTVLWFISAMFKESSFRMRSVLE